MLLLIPFEFFTLLYLSLQRCPPLTVYKAKFIEDLSYSIGTYALWALFFIFFSSGPWPRIRRGTYRTILKQDSNMREI